jgi:hypothetical protein
MAYCGPRGIALSTFLRWPRSDQDAALDWADYEAGRCRNCFTHPDEWGDNPLAFHAHPDQCKGCQARERMAQAPGVDDGQRGVTIRIAHGPAAACPRCRPDDTDDDL